MNTIVKAPKSSADKQLVLPPLLSKPIGFIPEKLHSTVITRILNVLLAQAIKDGGLDFLQGNGISVLVSDLNLKFALTLSMQGKLVVSQWHHGDNLNITGTLYDFMLLASRQEDSDTLFFHRRLKMEGNTDLGLQVKNLLDGMDTENVRFHKQLDFVLHHGIKVFEKLLK